MLIGLLLTSAKSSHAMLVSVGLTLQGIFLNFQEHLLCIYSTLALKKLFFTVLQQQTAFLRGDVPQLIFC